MTMNTTIQFRFLGYCTNSLELGCDCLGHIHYFDVAVADSRGHAQTIRKAICMHEEDVGLLWKHVEYRNGHSESRRSRELVLSFIATVVNYEYLFYWRFKLDGSLELEIKLSGELSTNRLSPDEWDSSTPTHGTLVAPNVNAQLHQHLFCARLDMAVDGPRNSISEINVLPDDNDNKDEWSHAFRAHETVLKREQEAVRTCNPSTARSWTIWNPHQVNPMSHKPVAYQLVPFTRGPAMPTLLTPNPQSTVYRKGQFATANLWVTPYDYHQRFPAGEYLPQSMGYDPEQDQLKDNAPMDAGEDASKRIHRNPQAGLPQFIQDNRSIEDTHLVVWHAFGLTHVPRVEDFPVMPCESTGFTLRPNGFLLGNPSIHLPPEINTASKLHTTTTTTTTASSSSSSSSCCNSTDSTTAS